MSCAGDAPGEMETVIGSGGTRSAAQGTARHRNRDPADTLFKRCKRRGNCLPRQYGVYWICIIFDTCRLVWIDSPHKAIAVAPTAKWTPHGNFSTLTLKTAAAAKPDAQRVGVPPQAEVSRVIEGHRLAEGVRVARRQCLEAWEMNEVPDMFQVRAKEARLAEVTAHATNQPRRSFSSTGTVTVGVVLAGAGAVPSRTQHTY